MNKSKIDFQYDFFINYCISAIIAAIIVSAFLYYIKVPLQHISAVVLAGVYYLAILGLQTKLTFVKNNLGPFIVYGALPFIFYALHDEVLSSMTPAFLYFFPIITFFSLSPTSGILAVVLYVMGIIAVYSYSELTFPLYHYDQVIFSIIGVIFTSAIGFFVTNARDKIEALYFGLSQKYSNYKLAVSQATNHIIITDVDGHVIFANEAAQKITGYSLDEMLGQTPRLWGGLQTSDFYKYMWKTIKIDKINYSGTVKNRRKNGELYTAIAHIAPILDEKQDLIGFIGAEEDVTKLIDLENKLKQDKELDEALLSSLGEGVVAQGKDGKVIFMNKAAQDMLLYTEQDVFEKSFVQIVKAESLTGKPFIEQERPLAKATIIKKTITEQLVYIRKDGTKFESEVVISPIYINGTEYYGDIQVFKDITKEKEIDKAKTEFISLASHQLRTPLSTINWYCEMLLDGDAGQITDEQRKFVGEAYDGSRRMSKLVNALLNVSRIETGTFMVQPEKTDIIKLIRSVLDESKPLINEKKLLVNLNKEEIPQMMLDPNLITIILQNLLTNAIKYTFEGGKINIDIKIVKAGANANTNNVSQDSLFFQVQDTGLGIPTNQRTHIFQKMFRADNVRKLNTDGNGLGLYMVKALVEHSHGKIWFESEEGKGATFFVLLPLTGMVGKEGTRKLSA